MIISHETESHAAGGCDAGHMVCSVCAKYR